MDQSMSKCRRGNFGTSYIRIDYFYDQHSVCDLQIANKLIYKI